MNFKDASSGGFPGRDGSVDRPRLRALLDGGESSALTVVVAPAGWGKSVLLFDWARSAKRPTCWIGVEKSDNDPGHLVRMLHDGLQNAFGELPNRVANRMDFLTSMSAPGRAEEVSRALGESGEVILVVDDLHLLVEPLAVAAIQRFVEAIPDNVHLVLSARHDPPFPLGRLRVTGDLTELRQSDLAFTADEVSDLLDSSGIVVEPDVQSALLVRTEGWGAALRLAAFSMHRSQDPARVVSELLGTDKLISEYLIEEVLDEAPAGDLSFLLRTSILNEINGSLAEALTGQRDGQQLLERLVSSGLFTRRSVSPGWFRYHHLFRGLLRTQLYEVDPDLVPELHRTAARWLHEHDEPVEAIEHAIAAGDFEDASAWLGAAATGLMSIGQGQTVVNLSGLLRDAVPEPSFLLLMTRLWALYGSGHAEVDPLFESLIARLRMMSANADPAESVHGGDPRSFVDSSALPWLLGAQARSTGDLQGLMVLDDRVNFPSPSGRVEAWVGEGYLWIEGFARADELLSVYAEHAQHDAYPPSIVHSSGLRACSLIGQGRFVEADLLIEHGMTMVEHFGIGHLIHSVYVQLALGWICLERGHLAEAEATLVASQANVEQLSDVPLHALHAILRSRTHSSLGDRAGAVKLLDQSSIPTPGRVGGGHFADRVVLERARLDLLAATPELAAARLSNWEMHLASYVAPSNQVLRARIAAAIGSLPDSDYDRLTTAPSTGLLHRIEVCKLVAATCLDRGDEEQAIEALVTAMKVAAECGAIQRVLDERDLFGAAFAQAVSISGLTETFGIEKATGAQSPLFEPLTERELEVLQQLSTHLTYNQMADDMFVSPNTMKTHAKHIYRKLAVSTRAEAVDRAREFGLIEP